MPDTPCNNSFKITSIAHGSTYFYDPVGGSLDESIDWFEHRAGSRVSPAVGMNSYSLRGSAQWGLMATPIVRGTSGSLVFVVKQVDTSANNTITATNMLAGQASFAFSSPPH